MTHTKQSLTAFTNRVREAFLDKQIRAPIHLPGGNEAELIGIFKNIRPTDWVFSTWRSSYHAILHGIPEEWVFDEIVAGRSMYLFSKKHKFLASSIVGGMLPIACGVAMAAKRLGRDEMVHVFVGDMTARCGIFQEFLAYCDGFELPVSVVIEDNGLSTNTPTVDVWGGPVQYVSSSIRIVQYSYERTEEHVGVGRHIQF